jgi:hypothetical protein
MSETPRDNESQNPTQWDNLSEQPSYEDVRAEERATAMQELKDLSREYSTLENDFIDRFPEAQQKFADDHEKQTSYNRFFIQKYEDKISYNRRRSEANARLAEITNPYYLAQYDSTAISGDRDRSIEAQSGVLYTERLRDLENAIQETGGNEEHETLLRQTWPKVRAHIEYRHMSRSEVLNDPNYDRNRTEAHNTVIDQLNAINELAQQYGTRPFTCRSFATSRAYRQASDPTGRRGQVLMTDRAIVQQYFNIAFDSAAKALINKLERENF